MRVRYYFESRARTPGASWRTVAVFYTLAGARAFVSNTDRDAEHDWRIVAC